MKKGIHKPLLLLVPVYLFYWLLSYVIINQDLNITLAYEYFILAWSFDGLARPMYVWWLSGVLFIFTAITYMVKRS